MNTKIVVFDTTLRDGEQAGHKMPPKTKLAIAHRLADIGVDVIEAGFPISSFGDATAVENIAREVKGSIVCALARITEDDIETGCRAIERAQKPRIHTFLATSDIHLKYKLRINHEQALEMITRGVRRARELCDDVEFSPEDATRSGWRYLAQAVRTAIEAGATVINIPDTVGYSAPQEFASLISYLVENTPELSSVTLSVHCHNDLGMAVANTLAGLSAGARQFEGTFLGIGERAGNASIEEIVMALKKRVDLYGFETNIKTEKIGPLCRFISDEIGHPISEHKPIVGRRALSHSSGIHQDGVIKDRSTYEIMTAKEVGWEGTDMELVSQLGRAGIEKRLCELGYDGAMLVERVHPHFKELADIKQRLSDDDLRMLAHEAQEEATDERRFQIHGDEISYHLYEGKKNATAHVCVWRNGVVKESMGSGDGAVSAVCDAIQTAILLHGVEVGDIELCDYSVIKGAGGLEANGWVVVKLTCGAKEFMRRSGDPDVIKASAKAYLRALNDILFS